jgi:hypothetical protein
MKVIHKLILNAGTNAICVGPSFRPISVGRQFNEIAMWFEVDPTEKATQNMLIEVHGTGFTIPEQPGTFLGTVLTHQDQLVWHVYSKEG